MSLGGGAVFAAFDFDGTLTRRDTLLPFLLYACGGQAFIWHITLLMPVLAAYTFRMIGNERAKERVLTQFLAGKPSRNIQEKAEEFAAHHIQKWLRPEAMRRLSWHLEQGHRCVLVSASLELYLRPWAKRIGFHDVIGSRLEISRKGCYTGRLLGANCYGKEKKRRLEDILRPVGKYKLYAYGDSRGDHELLEMADYGYYRVMPMSRT